MAGVVSMSGSFLENVSTLFCVLVTLCAFTSTAVWNLQTGRCYEKLKFRHHNPILCVKIDKALVMSSCDKGLVKMWGMETASLLKVRWSVLCHVNVFIDLLHKRNPYLYFQESYLVVRRKYVQ